MKTLLLTAIATHALLFSSIQAASAQVTVKQAPLGRTNTAGKLIRPTVKVPESLHPTSAAKASTAQAVSARGNKPVLKALPDFPVTTRNGLVVSSQTLTQKNHWLLIYRRDICIPCDRIMNVLAAGSSVESGQGQAYAVVVAGKDKDELERVRSSYSSLSNATWVSDKDALAFKALKARGAPIVYGMEGANIMWMVPGNLGNPANLEHMASAWVASNTLSSSLLSTATTGK